MENIAQKAEFLRHGFTAALSQLNEDSPRRWGKMNAWQMTEHMAEYVCIANGKIHYDVVTPEERLPRMQGFLASDKPFPENTPNQLMPDTPAPVKHTSMADAIAELQHEIGYFFEEHEKEQDRVTPNPFFGGLNFDQQVQLLYKHATHHLRQFGIDV